MKTIKIFEPAMCCPTGLCGVSVDPELLRISTVLNTLKQNGIEIQRFNLTSAPMEFVKNKAVTEYLQKFGPDKLPVVLVDDSIDKAGRKVIFTMGKGGVGKITVAAAIALGLTQKGKKVHLTTTDPAAHLKFVLEQADNLTMSHIDEHDELKKYQEEVLSKARENGLSGEDIAYIEEDLRSPCTQEIAVFRAFAEIVEKADDQIVVIDTAPTGHTLLLLESTESYDKEIQRTKGETPESVKRLLPRLKSEETEVVIVALPEATPVYEALRLENDLGRAQIAANWWIINQSFYQAGTTNALLKAKASNEVEWINRIDQHTGGKFALIAWSADQIKGDKLLEL